MKILITVIALFAVGTPAFAVTLNTECGMNKSNGEKIRLEILLDQADAFSSPVILSINDEKPRRKLENGAGGFGPKGYEHIKLNMTNGCVGSAAYSHFNADMPMNPMEDLTLKCICK